MTRARGLVRIGCRGTRLMIPRMLPPQQCGAVLLSTVHELAAIRVSKAHILCG